MLMEHNKEAYEQFKAMLLEHRECCLVAATGGGKTYITLQLIKDLKLKALIICHRIAIQNEWQKIINKYDIAADIDFVTYQMFSRNYNAFNGYDAYIFDEAHHMGSKVWGRAIEKFRSQTNNNPMIIGLTADPNRYETKIKRKINNVALTIFNNHVVYGYNRTNAIEDGVFLPAQYVYAIFDIEGIRSKYSKMKVTDELMGRLSLSIENCSKIDEILIRHTSRLSKIKGILFVEDIESIISGKELIEKTFPDLCIYVIHSKLSRKENDKVIKLFEMSDSGFIIAVDMINEGVHFSGINTIIMLRRTQSPSLYNQQIGRAFSSNAIDNAIIFDLVGNSRSIKNTLKKFSMEPNYTIIRPLENNKVYEKIISNQHIIYDYATSILDVLEEIDLYNLKNKPWTPEEDEIIRKYYISIGAKGIGEILTNRTILSIRSRAKTLKISMYNVCPWTVEEEEILRKYYPSLGINGVREMLNNRTDADIKTKVCRLEIPTYKCRRWTQEEDEMILKYYRISSIEDMVKMLKNRTVSAIRSRAKQLNLTNKGTWTPEEDEIIQEYYISLGPSRVCKMLNNRSETATRLRAKHFGLRMHNKWTSEEEEILREYYPLFGVDGVRKMLNNKSDRAIQAKAKYIGLVYTYRK